MKLFNRAGQLVDVPDEQAHQAITSGQFAPPQGTQVPVRINGQIGSVPSEYLAKAISESGAEVVSSKAYEQAELQAKYGDIKHQALAAGVEAADTATLGLSNVLIGANTSRSTRQDIRKSIEANPISAGLGTAAGIVVPVAADVLTGGAATPAVEASATKALARAGERALVEEGAAVAKGGRAVVEPFAGLRATPNAVEQAVKQAERRGVPVARGLEDQIAAADKAGAPLPREAPLPASDVLLSKGAAPAPVAPSFAGTAANDFEALGKTLSTHSPALPPRMAEGVARVAATEAAPTVASYGRGIIRAAVEDSLLAPQRLVVGAGKVVEDAVAKIVGRDSELALGRIGQKAVAAAARGAVEGGLYNTGTELGHQFLQDDPGLNGERLASAWVHGALLGGAFGGGLGLLGQSAQEILSRSIGKEGVSDYLSKKAGEYMWHAAGPTQKMTEAANKYAGGIDKVGNLIRQDAQEILGRSPSSREELLALAPQIKEKHGAILDAVLGRLDDAERVGSRVTVGEILGDLKAIRKGLFDRAAPTATIDKFMSDVVNATEARGSARRGIAGVLTGEILENKTLSFKQLRDIRRSADELSAFNSATDKSSLLAMREARKALEKRLLDAADRVADGKGGTLKRDYIAAKRGWQAGELLEQAAGRGVAKEATNQFHSLMDKLLEIPGAMIGHSVAGPIGGIASGLATAHASKFIRRNFDFVVSDVLAKLASVKRGAHVLDAAQQTNERVAKCIGQGLGAVKRRIDGGAAEPLPPTAGPKTYEERREAVLNLAANHDLVIAHLGELAGPLGTAAPGVSEALTAASVRTLTYLVDALPKPPPPSPSSLTPDKDQKAWKPSNQAKLEFNQKYVMAVHPETALALVAAGDYTATHDAALTATHPAMKKDQALQLAKAIDKATKPVPRNVQGSVRIFMGVPQTEPSLGRLYQSNLTVNVKPPTPRKPMKLPDNTSLNKSKE